MCSIKLNEIVKKFLLAGDQFRPEMHLKQPGFTYSPCELFTKKKKEFKNLKKQKIQNIFDELELNKACVQHDMAYGDFKNIGRRTASDKCLRDKAFNIAKDPKYNGYQRCLASRVSKFFDKKSASIQINLLRSVVLLHLQINLLLIMELNKMNN